MTHRDNILQELKDLKSDLPGSGFQNPYQAPAGYFNGLADEILKKVKAMESTSAAEELENLSPLLSSISKKMPHSVPAGYFDTLEKKLGQTAGDNQSVKEELETLSPLLSGLNNKKTYTVPGEYFQNLSDTINKKITPPETKVIPITSRKWFHYASAAVVVGFVVTMGFLFLNKKETVDPASKSYAWVKKNMKKVSTEDINEFVELAGAGTADVAKSDAKAEIEITNLLKDVSDKEIQDFLNDTQAAESETNDNILN